MQDLQKFTERINFVIVVTTKLTKAAVRVQCVLKPGYHIIFRIVPIAPVVSKLTQAIRRLYGNASKTLGKTRTIARIANSSIRAIGVIETFSSDLMETTSDDWDDWDN